MADELRDKIDASTYRLFESFLELANIGDLHPFDEERWRQFVIQTHLDGTTLYDTDLSDAIRERFPGADEFSVEMGGRFVDERELLEQYDKERNE